MRKILVRLAAAAPQAAAAYRTDGEAFTAGALLERAEAVGRSLPAGARRVGVWVDNTVASLTAVHGVWLAGGAAVVISHLVPEGEARRRLAESAAEALVVARAGGLTVEPLSPPSPSESADEAVVMFTSGTTGRPQAASMTFSAMEAGVSALAAGRDLPVGGRRLVDPPRPPNVIFTSLAHMGGFMGSVAAWFIGKPVLPVDKFSAELAFEIDARFQVTSFGLTPAMLYDLAYFPGPARLEHVRAVSVGTAPLPDTTRLEFERRYGIPVLRNYGQTEFGTIAMERLSDIQAGRRPPGSTGRVAPGVEIRILDTDRRDLAPGEIGEVWVRGRSSMSGYLGADGRPTAAGLDGWLSTGDLGSLDGDGFLSLVGRAREVVICGGFNVYPAMVEAALNRLPGVLDSAVAGVPDDRLGEVPVAAVVLRNGVSLSLESARNALREELAPFELPRDLLTLQAIPRMASGKVDRPQVAALFGR